MKPVVPIVPGLTLPVTEYAKDQLPYQPLPVYKHDDGVLLSRWHLSWRERLTVLLRGDVYLWVSTFNKPLQPVALAVSTPKPEMTDCEGDKNLPLSTSIGRA